VHGACLSPVYDSHSQVAIACRDRDEFVVSADGGAHAYHHGRHLQDLYLIEGLQ